MTDVEQAAIDTFGKWLRELASDASTVADAVADESVPASVKRPLAGSLNYLFKSLDLIDDGIEGLGFLDDAFVLRVAADQAKNSGSLPEGLGSLAEDAELIREALGDLYARLDKFVASLVDSSVRGRSVEAIVNETEVREGLLGDVRGWASRYTAPAFVMDEQGLVKLRAFLAAKLP
jgi:uncharacterized membrane protein YkvA (DUF1232 family)